MAFAQQLPLTAACRLSALVKESPSGPNRQRLGFRSCITPSAVDYWIHPLTGAKRPLSEDDMIDPAIARCISRRTRLSIGRVDLRTGAINADARHSIRFETPSGASLISILRTTYDKHEQSLEYGHMLLRCDRCQNRL